MAVREDFDVLVIGGGPGGYVASVRAAQLGLKTACVEKDERLGGVCLNVGCIPSKALLDSSEYLHLAQNRMAEHGVGIDAVRLDLSVMMARKERIVRELTENVRSLLDAHKIQIIRGRARLLSADRVEIHDAAGDSRAEPLVYRAGAILLATGSEPVALPGVDYDGRHIVSSTEALAFAGVPKHLVVVGGGYIGLELGSVWRRLGAKVTIIELLPRIAPTLDGQVARTLERSLARQGLSFVLGTKVTGASVKGKRVTLTLQTDAGVQQMDGDRVLVAVGRRPLTRDLGLERAGVALDERTGTVLVDARYQTSVSGVYAIGDLIAGPMLAHKASAEGIAAVECIAGLPGEVNYDAIPSVIYTTPEAAAVGMTEEQAKERKIPHCVGTYPFTGAGRARCMGETEGFAKVLAHAGSRRILGLHVVGARAADMIAEGVLAIELGATTEDLARTVHGHPTFAEALQEAALVAQKCSIYAS